MPGLQLAAKSTPTVTTTKQVKLAPQLKKKLLVAMKEHAAIAAQIKVLEFAKKGKRDKVEDILVNEIGEESLSIDGYKATFISPIKTRLDKAKLIAQGVTMAQIEMATITTPGKSYTKITAPGAAENEED